MMLDFNTDLGSKGLFGGLWHMQCGVHGTECCSGGGGGIGRICRLAVVGGSLLQSTEILDADMFLGSLGSANGALDKRCSGGIWLPHGCRRHTPLGTPGIRRTRLGGTLALVRRRHANAREVVLLYPDGISHSCFRDQAGAGVCSFRGGFSLS